MDIQRCTRGSFSVIGKLGSTRDGDGFIRGLWNEANSHFSQVEALAKRHNGQLAGTWGLMSDFTGKFLPWSEGLSQGLYLAGVEVEDEAKAPESWTKWVVPAFEYVYLPVDGEYREALEAGLGYIRDENLELAGAIQEFNCQEEHKMYLFFPIGRVEEA